MDARVAVGDIHGDIVKAAGALCAAGVLGEEDGLPVWTGGNTTIVQIGDVLDRGDSEIGELITRGTGVRALFFIVSLA